MEEEEETRKTLAVVVNPISGMGGSVGLRGTDGRSTLAKAVALGARKIAPARARVALGEVRRLLDEEVRVISAPGEMGEEEARASGFAQIVVVGGNRRNKGETSAADTTRAVRGMLAHKKPDLVLFAGGDGTARDVAKVVDGRVPVLGIPTGVKMYSAVFGVNPREAGALAAQFLAGEARTRPSEVMDVDEAAFSRNRLLVKLHGFVQTPYMERAIQDVKVVSAPSDEQNAWDLAGGIVNEMKTGWLYIIGPGTTTKKVMERLGLKKYSLLGVDVIADRRLLARDANESALLRMLKTKRAKIIVSPIGGQGFIFGRGNQQVSAGVISKVGKENVMVVATARKLASLEGRPMLVDTGDDAVDRRLRGYARVMTGASNVTIYPVA